jgi:hypothetical protein
MNAAENIVAMATQAAVGRTPVTYYVTPADLTNFLRTALLGTQAACAIDSARSPLHHIQDMPETQITKERRSSRVFTRIPVHAAGKNSEGRKFRAKSQTIVVNAHGGLLYLNESLELGADLVLINPATEEEQECRIVYLGDTSEKGTRVGVEFLSPSPHFWGVEFAQQDWPAISANPAI